MKFYSFSFIFFICNFYLKLFTFFNYYNKFYIIRNNDDNKSKYQVVYRANTLHQFIKRLFMIREHLIKNFE